jgi:hypothetical protein
MKEMSTAIIKPQWGPLTIALMVLGFIVFWPLGLAMLAYIIWGEKFGGSAEKAGSWMNQKRAWAENCGSRHSNRHYGGYGRHSSGNAAFDDYREQQLKRLDEERKRLDDEINAFHEHMRNLRMARDREEFDRFMSERNTSRPNGDQPNGDQGTNQGGGV